MESLEPILEVAHGISGKAVAEALDRAIALHGKPRSITVGHGTEFTPRALELLLAGAASPFGGGRKREREAV